jgi:hypothetical protein
VCWETGFAIPIVVAILPVLREFLSFKSFELRFELSL